MGAIWYWFWFGVKMLWWRGRYAAVDRALLMMRQGVYYDLERAHRISVNKHGEIFAFGSDGIAYVFDSAGQKKAQAHQRDVFETYEGERMLFMVDGEVITCPVEGTGKQMDAEALSNFNRGDAVAQLSRSFRSAGAGLNWGSLRWFLLIGGLAVIAFVVWRFVFHGHIPGTPTIAPTPTPSPTPSASPIYTLVAWASWVVSNA